MKKYEVIGRVGGPGTFWEGFEYSLGIFRFYIFAFLRAWIHVKFENRMRMARVKINDN